MASDWKEFELFCEEIARQRFHPEYWRIRTQRRSSYCDETTKVMDIHVAERRSGGYHFVFDAKHFAKSKLHRGEVRDVYDYKRRSRCSKAFILVPHYTEIYDSAVEEAEKLGIGIVELNYGASPLLAGIAFYDQTWPEIKTIIRQNDDPSWIRTIFKYLSGR